MKKQWKPNCCTWSFISGEPGRLIHLAVTCSLLPQANQKKWNITGSSSSLPWVVTVPWSQAMGEENILVNALTMPHLHWANYPDAAVLFAESDVIVFLASSLFYYIFSGHFSVLPSLVWGCDTHWSGSHPGFAESLVLPGPPCKEFVCVWIIRENTLRKIKIMMIRRNFLCCIVHEGERGL